MKARTQLLGSAAIIITGLATMLTHGGAEMKGFRYNEKHPGCQTIAEIWLDNGVVMKSEGHMQMDVVWTSEDDDPVHKQVLRSKSFFAVSEDPVLGRVEWRLDDSRPAEDAVIQGNIEGQDFPATCDLYFHIIAVFSKIPDLKLQSRQPVHMQSTSLQSFSPHVNEVYTLISPVDFVDVDDPEKVVFTVKEISSILN